MNSKKKPIVGFSVGDINGIGLEIILKTLGDNRILEHCVPVIFGSNKVVNFYRKSLPEHNFQYQSLNDFSKLNPKTISIYNCWEEEVNITPGMLNETGGTYARKSLIAAVNALKNNDIDALVTAPFHKSNVQSQDFSYTGHTPYLKSFFEAEEVVMLLMSETMRVALVTEHIPVKEVANHLSTEGILKKLRILNQSLKTDLGISRPKIAVLGLNPHAGDDGLVGKEEQEIIMPAIEAAKNERMLAFGPYSADAFFARSMYAEFDAVLAMYHDQGLIPFKSLSPGSGVNYTAGLPAIRTSPDHGTAFDIAGKAMADHTSMLAALYQAIDILEKRQETSEMSKNALVRKSQSIVANSVDETIQE